MRTSQPLKDLDQLRLLIDEIGIARFEARCAAGAIDHDAGDRAMHDYVAKESDRPIMSRIANFLTDSREVYRR